MEIFLKILIGLIGAICSFLLIKYSKQIYIFDKKQTEEFFNVKIPSRFPPWWLFICGSLLFLTFIAIFISGIIDLFHY